MSFWSGNFQANLDRTQLNHNPSHSHSSSLQVVSLDPKGWWQLHPIQQTRLLCAELQQNYIKKSLLYLKSLQSFLFPRFHMWCMWACPLLTIPSYPHSPMFHCAATIITMQCHGSNRTAGQQEFHNITTSTGFFLSLWHTAQIRPRLPHCWGF